MDDEYVDVVDEPGASEPAKTATGRPRRAAAQRRFDTPDYADDDDEDDRKDGSVRGSRSSARPRITLGSGPAPKLKLKLSEKSTAALAPGMSFLGAYDRELDSDDEDLTFEEQFVLRLPPGEDLEKLRSMVQSREVGNDVWFKFKGTYTGCYKAS